MKQLAKGAAGRQRNTNETARRRLDPEALIAGVERLVNARGRSGQRRDPDALLKALSRAPLGQAGRAEIRKN